MKTFKAVLIFMMLSGQLSFGMGNETCCPDTTSVALASNSMQVQLDLLQTESQDVKVTLPSLNQVVANKLTGEHAMLKQMENESERVEAPLTQPISKQVQFTLSSRILEQKMADRR